MEALDASQAQAIDGVGGGTYTPSTKIIINGQGLQVISLTVTGLLTLNGNTTIGNSGTDHLTVVATSTFSSPVTLNDTLTANSTADFFGDLTTHSSTLTGLAGDVNIGLNETKALTVNATSTFNAPITAFESVDIWGDLTCHSATTFSAAGDVNLGNDAGKSLSIGAALVTLLNLSGEGRVPLNDGGTLSGTTNQTISARDGQIFKVGVGMTGGRAYTLTASGAVGGDCMIFYTGPGSGGEHGHVIQILSPTVGQSIQFAAGTTFNWALYAFRDDGWNLVLASDVGLVPYP